MSTRIRWYLIWSEEHGAWWNQSYGGQTWGYTHSIEQAGRYLKEEAEAIVAKGNKVIHSDTGFFPDRKFNELLVPDPMSDREQRIKDLINFVSDAADFILPAEEEFKKRVDDLEIMQ